MSRLKATRPESPFPTIPLVINMVERVDHLVKHECKTSARRTLPQEEYAMSRVTLLLTTGLLILATGSMAFAQSPSQNAKLKRPPNTAPGSEYTKQHQSSVLHRTDVKSLKSYTPLNQNLFSKPKYSNPNKKKSPRTMSAIPSPKPRVDRQYVNGYSPYGVFSARRGPSIGSAPAPRPVGTAGSRPSMTGSASAVLSTAPHKPPASQFSSNPNAVRQYLTTPSYLKNNPGPPAPRR
jgi:hypothetical protein